MTIRFHPRVPFEVAEIQDYYESEAGPHYSDEFYHELTALLQTVAGDPMRFPPYNERLRRVNLKRFPFHVLFEARKHFVYVTIVRHNKRHPSFGLKRK